MSLPTVDDEEIFSLRISPRSTRKPSPGGGEIPSEIFPCVLPSSLRKIGRLGKERGRAPRSALVASQSAGLLQGACGRGVLEGGCSLCPRSHRGSTHLA
mmetsp:Transcript_13938/g.40837  ORF Transcript_13938/g.40837 Transcript_13938/m.40837 type:complete len:99 (+) Transcript_13938:1995-2291(+)